MTHRRQESASRAPHQKVRRRTLSSAIIAVIAFSFGAALGPMLRSQDGPTPADHEHDIATSRASIQPAATTSKTAARAVRKPYVARDVAAYVPKDAHADAVYRVEQSRELVDLVRRSVTRASLFVPPEGGPEMIANQVAMYQSGWIDSLVRTAPNLVDELASEIERSMCSSETSDAELIVMSRTVSTAPELANSAAFDCLFSKRRGEDVVLWSAVEAWRRSGLPKTDVIAEVERSAKDDRTRAHFTTGMAHLPEPGEPLPTL